MKNRISIWTYGGVGGGLFSQGIPMMVKIIEGLGKRNSISVYSFVSVPKSISSKEFKIYTPPESLKIGLLRWAWLIVVFLFHHIRQPFHLLFGFWIYPSGWLVTRLGKLLNRPSIVYAQGGELANIPKLNYGLLRNSKQRNHVIWTLKNADKVIVLTNFQTSIIKELEISRELRVIPWGADPNLFKFERKSWTHFNCLHVANLNPVKDQGTLILSFAEILKTIPGKLKIVGGDFNNGETQQLVKQLNLEDHVEFIGPIPYESLSPYFNWANIMMHTSVYEGMGMSLIEGAASGLLLAGTDVGILNDFDSSSCIKVNVGDFKSLASEITNALSRPERCEEMTHRLYEWTKAHDFNWTLDQLQTEINSSVKNE